MDNFLNAAARGEIEPTKGVSASIICGKRATIGTGMIGLRIDIEHLPQSRVAMEPIQEDSATQEEEEFVLPMDELSLEDESTNFKLESAPVMVEI